MDALEIILGIIIMFNFIINISTRNRCAVVGWLVAGFEWFLIIL
jgi:hypothetical protein